MARDRGLVIIHLDGLGHHYLQRALTQGHMPFVQQLIDDEGYVPMRWRCGLPSTTPYVQAGLMFGDNREIPSFRWWDKEANRLIVFGGISSFKYVSDKYFRGAEPLLAQGAAIATCYTAEAIETYRLSYRHRAPVRDSTIPTQHASLRYSAQNIAASWLMNPLHLLDLARTTFVQVWKAYSIYWQARRHGWRQADKYLVTNMLEEIFLQQMTRYATTQAMRENYPIIYAAFYTYDGMAHAFGPESEYSFRSLKHIDHSIQSIAHERQAHKRDYEILILSDHGQSESVPYTQKHGRTFGQWIAEWLPTYQVEEFNGRKFTPAQTIEGHIALTYSGGLAHLYFKDLPGRLDRTALEEKFPGLIEKVARAPGVGFVMVRDGASDLIVTPDSLMPILTASGVADSAHPFFAQFDEPEVIARQLHKLNSFERSGDLIIFGAYADRRQINFEYQMGGHGSLGGEQLFPFILAKREWGMETRTVGDACDLYSQLKRLRDGLLKAPQSFSAVAGRSLAMVASSSTRSCLHAG